MYISPKTCPFWFPTHCNVLYTLHIPSSTSFPIYLVSSIQLAPDEGKCLLAVLVDVLLVRVGVVAGAAVRVSRVAVRLDDGRARGGALKASGTGRELT